MGAGIPPLAPILWKSSGRRTAAKEAPLCVPSRACRRMHRRMTKWSRKEAASTVGSHPGKGTQGCRNGVQKISMLSDVSMHLSVRISEVRGAGRPFQTFHSMRGKSYQVAHVLPTYLKRGVFYFPVNDVALLWFMFVCCLCLSNVHTFQMLSYCVFFELSGVVNGISAIG